MQGDQQHNEVVWRCTPPWATGTPRAIDMCVAYGVLESRIRCYYRGCMRTASDRPARVSEFTKDTSSQPAQLQSEELTTQAGSDRTEGVLYHDGLNVASDRQPLPCIAGVLQWIGFVSTFLQDKICNASQDGPSRQRQRCVS